MAAIVSHLSTLLFVQLGIVVALSFALLGLVIRRMRSAPGNDGYPPLDEDAWLHEVLEERKSQQDADLVDENRSLKEKLRFLEAKIIELEILGEQLDGLAALKAENERLRARLRVLEATVELPKQTA